MGREIKFRGLDFDGKWQYGFIKEIDSEGKTYSWIFNCGNLTPVKTETVGQFTGLKDRNGKEVYEGDITDAMENIIFNNGSFRTTFPENRSGDSLLTSARTRLMIITGNIHEKQEAL